MQPSLLHALLFTYLLLVCPRLLAANVIPALCEVTDEGLKVTQSFSDRFQEGDTITHAEGVKITPTNAEGLWKRLTKTKKHLSLTIARGDESLQQRVSLITDVELDQMRRNREAEKRLAETFVGPAGNAITRKEIDERNDVYVSALARFIAQNKERGLNRDEPSLGEDVETGNRVLSSVVKFAVNGKQAPQDIGNARYPNLNSYMQHTGAQYASHVETAFKHVFVLKNYMVPCVDGRARTLEQVWSDAIIGKGYDKDGSRLSVAAGDVLAQGGVEPTGQAGSESRAKPWLGVALKPQTEAEKRPVVDSVQESSPAEVAGFEPGDVLVSIAGTLVKDSKEGAAAIDRVRIGEPVPVIVERKGAPLTLTVHFREQPQEMQTATRTASKERGAVGPLVGIWKGTWSYSGDTGAVEIRIPNDPASVSGAECIATFSSAPKLPGFSGPFRIVGTTNDNREKSLEFDGNLGGVAGTPNVRVRLETSGLATAECRVSISSDRSYTLDVFVLEKR